MTEDWTFKVCLDCGLDIQGMTGMRTGHSGCHRVLDIQGVTGLRDWTFRCD